MSLSPFFEQGLKKLSMLKSNKEKAIGLYFLDSVQVDNPYIKLYIEEAKRYRPTAIYITQFDNNQSPKPQIYIYDNTSNQLSGTDIDRLHKRLWNAYKVPMFFVFYQTEVKIYNCLQEPNISNTGELEKISPLETMSLVSEISEKLKAFKAQMFDSGAFWDTEYKDNFSFDNSVYQILLDELKKSREKLIEKEILPKKLVDSLFIKSILLRYLEERDVFNHHDISKKPYWDKFQKGATSFTHLFSSSQAIVNLLDDLKERFNGGVFDISKDEEKEILNADLSEFKYFLEGSKDGRQLILWSRYSFKDLPIELISNIYELFLKSEDKGKKGIVYTPPILVNLMIDEIMPLDKPQKDFKLIDPSCGSGIFLVAAYKRLIQWWMLENKWEKPSTDVAKKIILKSIYGVDKEEGAVHLAIFSLSLALCDTFLPDAIWNQLKFDNLEESKNVIKQDFFEYIQNENNHNTFDLVIGNPPFLSDSDSKSFKELEQKEFKNRPKIENKVLKLPDKQLAFLFIEQSFKLLKKDAYLCMVQPSAFLYASKAQDFRNYLFENYKCKQILDFACLNSSLFKRKGSGANVAVSTVFMQKQKPNVEKDAVLHITVRQTFLAKEKIYFDLSHYDFHWLSYKDVLEQKSIWKCDLMGGGRIKSIIQRLLRYKNLANYLEEKEANQDWSSFKEGYQIEGKDKYKENHDADYITNKMSIPADALLIEGGINKAKIFKQKEKSFHRPKRKEKLIFEPPHLLFRKVISKDKIIVEYSDDYLTFNSSVIGLHAPKEDREELKFLEERLKKESQLYIFYLSITSGRAGVSMATSLLKKDLEELPYPKKSVSLKPSVIEQYLINDTLDYMIDFCKGNKNSPLLFDVTTNQLKEFQAVYCDLLNSMYDDFKSLGTFETDSFIGCSFYFKDKPSSAILENSKDLNNDLFSIINNKVGQNINIKRILRFYDDNVIYIIKPKQYRFWLKSIAIRDADETFADLIKMGY